ncbi:hypothetical protein [uncultured Duncaniella sp.]|uniref:hypothetical protein n=2 Tax=uncultured Duncaniella sp. TaxID=2768039 RepID=UPI0025DF7977|nr:hypothetical protein [uncultured Duncaniella sp.]
MTTSIFSSSVLPTESSNSEFVKGSHRSSNLDKSYMSDFDDDCSLVNEIDHRYSVEGYDMPDYDNDREIEEYLHELAITDELNEYYAYIDAMAALEPKKCAEVDKAEEVIFPRIRKRDARFYTKPIQSGNASHWLVIDSKDYSFEALELTERDALNLATSLNNRMTSVY